MGKYGKCKGIKNLGRSGGLCLNDPQLYLTHIFTLTFSHTPTHSLFSSPSPILIRYILYSLMFYPTLSYLHSFIPHKHIPIPSFLHLCSSGITQRYSSPYQYLTSIIHFHLSSPILTRYISWTTTQLLLPLGSSKNSPKTKIPETRSMTGFQGKITSNFSQWK